MYSNGDLPLTAPTRRSRSTLLSPQAVQRLCSDLTPLCLTTIYNFTGLLFYNSYISCGYRQSTKQFQYDDKWQRTMRERSHIPSSFQPLSLCHRTMRSRNFSWWIGGSVATVSLLQASSSLLDPPHHAVRDGLEPLRQPTNSIITSVTHSSSKRVAILSNLLSTTHLATPDLVSSRTSISCVSAMVESTAGSTWLSTANATLRDSCTLIARGSRFQQFVADILSAHGSVEWSSSHNRPCWISTCSCGSHVVSNGVAISLPTWSTVGAIRKSPTSNSSSSC